MILEVYKYQNCFIKSFANDFHFLGFLEKNRDTFNADLVQLIQVSKNKFLQSLFTQEFGMVWIVCSFL